MWLGQHFCVNVRLDPYHPGAASLCLHRRDNAMFTGRATLHGDKRQTSFARSGTTDVRLVLQGTGLV